MNFIYNFDQQKDTIAAISTPPGEGAISIIRISGPQAAEIIDRIFSKKLSQKTSHTVHFGKIMETPDKELDSVLAFLMKAPKSYTGEDLVEINCHGGQLITQKVLKKILETGARPALPGEFTLRAFLNHKIDLAQAEAVQSLISAKNTLALKAAQNQLAGKLTEKIKNLQKELIDIAADLEAETDFPEEEIETVNFSCLTKQLQKTLADLKQLSSSFETGKKFEEGITIAIIGTPNVGKSSLMNLLCQKEKAIVTDIPGTTRDLIEETAFLNSSFHFHLIDTAGIRTTYEKIEKEGIRRSLKALDNADMSLLVLDASRSLNPEDQKLIQRINPKKTILVWNKTDLNPHPPKIGLTYELLFSAKKQTGLKHLRKTIKQFIENQPFASKEELVLTKERHQNALSQAIKNCQKAIRGLQSQRSVEFISDDLRFALLSLGQIIGHDLTEDILSRIFSKFCIGK